MSTAKKTVVSACLAGVPCRYDGQSTEHPAVMALVKSGLALPVCPEQVGGLPTPRTPAEIVDDRVVTSDGQDVTEEYERGAQECLRLAQLCGCTRAVLQPRSPSCGGQIIYDGTFSGTLVPGSGRFAALCRENGLELVDPDDLQ